MVVCLYKALFENIVLMVENGGQRPQVTTSLGYTREQAEAIQKLKHAKDDYQRLGLSYGATRYIPPYIYRVRPKKMKWNNT